MKRRGGAGGKKAKASQRKAAAKRRPAPKPAVRREPADADLRVQLRDRSRELREARDQLTATAKVLQVISSSAFDLQTVLETLVESARTLCDAPQGMVLLRDGQVLRMAKQKGYPAAFERYIRDNPLQPSPHSGAGRAAFTGKVAHFSDVLQDPNYRLSEGQRLGGYRALLSVPLLREHDVVGVFSLGRPTPGPFTDRQIDLVRTFAAQAVIAIENTRLLSELHQRTGDLTESLERQTATAKVLEVISRSKFELQPILQSVLDTAMRLCRAEQAVIFRPEDGVYRFAAGYSLVPGYLDVEQQSPILPGHGTVVGRTALSRQAVRIDDAWSDPLYEKKADAKFAGVRSMIGVPLMREGEPIGVIALARNRVEPFADREIELVTTFADQAVIAIENVRLFGEVQARTHDLQESLARQTATSEILRVISQSPTDVQPVFDSIVTTAARLLRCDLVHVLLCDGATLWSVAVASPQGLLTGPGPGKMPIDRSVNFPSRAILDREMLHLPDWSLIDLPEHEREIRQMYGVNAALYLPLLRDDKCVGLLVLTGKRPNIFGPGEIAQAESFRDQALIAIENTRLFNETKEALEQQTATSDVLQVISSSPGELQPVFTSILDNATRICQANFGTLFLREGEALRVAAHHGSLTKAWDEQWRIGTVLKPDPEIQAFRTLSGRQTLQTLDLSKAASYLARNPKAVNSVEVGGIRTMATVPMLKDGEAIGVITVFRTEVREFTDKQIALVANFAAQAVIAIENARLLTELRESLEQQTATAEVLSVINSSPGDLTPVFDAMVEKALRLCQAECGALAIFEGDHYRAISAQGPPELAAATAYRPMQIHPESAPGRVRRGEDVVHIQDIVNTSAVPRTPALQAMIDLGRARTALWVSLRKDTIVVGFFALYRQEVRPFSEREIDLVRNFAAQAVIAIENARLLSELRQSLEQQTATAEVLGVINASRGDLQPVFEAMVEKARRLCEADAGHLVLPVGDDCRSVAVSAMSPEMTELIQSISYAPGRGTAIGRALAERRPVQISDIGADDEHVGRQAARKGFIRTILGVPLLREGEAIGAFGLSRQRVEPFSERQIDLVRTFADQAVIAIENARLFEAEQQRTRELTESLEQQTATAKVLEVISRSAFDLQAVFETVVESSARLCAADQAVIHRFDGEVLRVSASFNASPADKDWLEQHPIRPGPDSGAGRAALERRTIHNPDILADPAHTLVAKHPEETRTVLSVRSIVWVPILKGDDLLGVLSLWHAHVKPFTDKQIALVETFADQAAIAIENVRLFEAEQQRTRELTESLEQQTATADVLRVISSSPGDLEPVFAAMLESAVRICDAKFGNIYRWDGEALHLLAAHNTPPALAEARRQSAVRPTAIIGRMVRTKTAVHVADLSTFEAYTVERDPGAVSAVELGGVRTHVSVPMLKDNELIGSFTLYRQEVRPFSDKQIALVTSFASQAVIAIENARLLSELRESLEQQTATSEVLKVISSSPGELQPVFDVLLEKAMTLCDAAFGVLATYDGERFSTAAMRGVPVAYARYRAENPQPYGPGTGPMRVLSGERFVHVVDLIETEAYRDGEPNRRALVDLGGARTSLHVPLFKDHTLLGTIQIYRQEVQAFSDKQIALLESFAAQAVIAIENTRLLTELRARTDDLAESLEQQTATADVLRVISSSPGELQPVFEAMLANAVRICDATFGNIYRWDGDELRIVTSLNTPAAFVEARRKSPFRPGPQNAMRQMMERKAVVHIPDVPASQAYIEREPVTVEAVEIASILTLLAVPMVKENELVGAIALSRQEVRPFTDKQIALVTSFAAQAVIAIENTRLLTELRHRTDELGRSVGELRALGEVSQAVNSTLDLETVLSTIVAKAVQLSNTDAGAIYVFDEADREFHLRATYAMDRELIEALASQRIGLEETNVASAIARHEPTQTADLSAETSNALDEIILRAGYRARLVAPLLRGDITVGMLVVRRKTPGAFPQTTVDLIKTFAAQSVLAIQNARLFENVETRTGELARSLKDLQTAQDRLVQTEKLASLGQLTAGIAHEIKNPLNFVNNFSAVSGELVEELREALGGVHLDAKLRAEINEIADMLQGNLDKVVQHGKRADSIVKNMLLHSRAGSGEHRPVDINAVVEESLNLAYHGARAEKQGFNITLERSFDPAAGEVDLFPQEITRVLLNLISNGFYAATKRKSEGNGGDYEPTLSAATKDLGDSVEIRIRDNGTGIPPEVKEKMFNPFFTTKPAGEGTGLGLSLSHDIIVKQHSGSIEVDTQPGAFTEFRIVLPRGAATIAKSSNATSGEHA